MDTAGASILGQVWDPSWFVVTASNSSELKTYSLVEMELRKFYWNSSHSWIIKNNFLINSRKLHMEEKETNICLGKNGFQSLAKIPNGRTSKN